jgi:hypothetical protein
VDLSDVQVFRDLLSLLNSGGHAAQLPKWMETHFGS